MILEWEPVKGPPEVLARAFEDELGRILASWFVTPYVPGQQRREVGVDCVRFVAAVLDELLGRAPTPIETLPDDASMHDRRGSIRGMRRLRSLFMPNRPVEGRVQPGDVVVTGPQAGGPGHAMIVGARPNTLWHSAGLSVHWTGLLPPPGHKVFRVYRMSDEERVA